MSSIRRNSRVVALQTLYLYEITNLQHENNLDEIIGIVQKLSEPELNVDIVFTKKIVTGVLKNQKKIDDLITNVSENWTLDKIAFIDRIVMNIAIYEMLIDGTSEVPEIVALNEAIEIAKLFSTQQSIKFVNGVLGKIYKEIGEPNKERPKSVVKKSGGALILFNGEEGEEPEVLLVMDKFNKWTLPKGKIEVQKNEVSESIRVIKKKLDLDVSVEREIGRNSYISHHPVEGKIKKEVIYFLMYTDSQSVKISKDYTGITKFGWFKIYETENLPMYKDIKDLFFEDSKIRQITK